MAVNDADFSGYATKAGLKCSDGRTIMPDAFKHMDGQKVPLVWSHGHGDPENVLGYALLHAQGGDVYAYAFFNESQKAKHAKMMVQHGDVVSLSIYANRLVERSKQVFHGVIREVSLVLSGANPGALIDNVRIAHADGYEDEILADEVVIFTGLGLKHDDQPGEEEKKDEENSEDEKSDDDTSDDSNEEGEEVEVAHADGEKKAKEIYDTLNEEQKALFHYSVEAALEAEGDTAEHSDAGSDTENTTEGDLNHQEGNDNMRNVFEHNDNDAVDLSGDANQVERHVLSHSDIQEIKDTWKRGGSMRQAFQEFAIKHGIENLDALFPDPKAVPGAAPQFDKRRTEWVNGVIGGVSRSPFSRVKTLWADITHEQARALGYIKGNFKKEEFFGLSRRTTTPATVYKKQKLDRDDILDATDFDFVPWMKAEMRMMLEEEVARAILIGDGRPVEDPANPGEPNPDKIKDPAGVTDGQGIRSILNDHELFAATVNVPIPDASDTDQSYVGVVEQIMTQMEFYKGSGSPTLYTTLRNVNKMLLSKDGFGRRLWRTREELATEMGVDRIVDVEVFSQEPDLFGIVVNLRDYNVGTDRGGEVTMFDDFDLDYNQYKYLLETRFSGALVKIRSALVLKTVDSDLAQVQPLELAFDPETNTIDFVAQTGVVYSLTPGGTALAADVVIDEDTVVYARPASGYYFANNQQDEFSYTFNPDA